MWTTLHTTQTHTGHCDVSSRTAFVPLAGCERAAGVFVMNLKVTSRVLVFSLAQ